MPTDARLIRKWLVALGTLTASNSPQDELRKRVDGMAALLSREYDEWAFCTDSFAHVAKACRFFPTYAELCEHLTAWAKENRPATLRLAGPSSFAELTPIEREARDAQIDRDWWADRVKRVEAISNPTLRWREACGMLATLTRPNAHPREDVCARLIEIMSEAEWQGADTDERWVRYPPESGISLRHIADAPGLKSQPAPEEKPRGKAAYLSGGDLAEIRRAAGMPQPLVDQA